MRGWSARTPETFTFACKLPREITHERRFVGCRDVLEEFVANLRELGPRLGPILVQCGLDFSPSERDAFADFLTVLPQDVRFAVEFRQPQWIRRGTLALLREHGVALALSDGRWMPRAWLLRLCKQATDRQLRVSAVEGPRSHDHRLLAAASGPHCRARRVEPHDPHVTGYSP